MDTRPERNVVVVGTNGKSSTAAYLARLLTGAGRHTGLYTSPHLKDWTERIQVDLSPVARETFERTLLRFHEAAQRLPDVDQPGDLRFFDVLTLAAEDIFGRAAVEFGIFEAGVGGRLDATRALDPELVMLTSIGADHEAVLGTDPADRLWEKALAAGPGSALVSLPLGRALEQRLEEIAAETGFDLRILPPSNAPDRGVWRENLRLARAGAQYLLGSVPLPEIDHQIAGRSQRGRVDGVDYIADVAHNPTAWQTFLEELPDRPHVFVVAISLPRPSSELVRAIADVAPFKVAAVIATTTTVRRVNPPEEIAGPLSAAGLPAATVTDPAMAFEEAVERCHSTGAALAVFGSNFLVVDFLAWLRDRADA